jgi:photosystem II stability/assembly factor-like uncharacterized protein
MSVARADPAPGTIVPAPARIWPHPAGMVLFDLTRAGTRIVAVGEHGVIALSDDDGKTFRQARHSPVDCALTAVSFVDASRGFAVGHWGTIIASVDGGETWQLQRVDSAVDQPLFSVAFRSPLEGWAVGLWSILLHTEDGGKTWVAQHLDAPPGGKKADRNLNKIFFDAHGTIFVAAEQGNVLRSQDGGKTWVYLTTGYLGSFWTGLAASNGAIYVGGLRGSLYRSTDGGAHWTALASGSKASMTGLIENASHLTGVALDGYLFAGDLQDSAFAAHQFPDRPALTAVVANGAGRLVFASKSGILVK